MYENIFHIYNNIKRIITILKVNIGIIGHISIDNIIDNDYSFNSIGGPPCYSGLVSQLLGAKINIITKIGKDFPNSYFKWLNQNKLNYSNNDVVKNKKTTQFQINISKQNKQMKLINKCENIKLNQFQFKNLNGILISPIVNEIPINLNIKINSISEITMLDPQGYIRKFNKNGLCNQKNIKIYDLPKTNIIKISEQESYSISKINNFKLILKLLAKKYQIVLGTLENNNAYLLNENKIFFIRNPNYNKLKDRIGLGDIFNGVFLTMFLKGENILWSISMAMAIASSRKEHGINKINKIGKYKELTDNIYNNIKKIE